MKKFYIFFFALPVLAFTLLYLSTLWFIVAMVALLVFIAYRFFAERLEAEKVKGEVLENELEDLHIHLENAVLKEQKSRKEAEQIRQLKQQLLTVISHEVRTPMNGVMGMSLLLAETPLTKEQEEYVTTIRNCGESLLTTVNNLLVNDILDFSKLQLESKQLEYKDFDLRDSIEEVLEMFGTKAGKANIDLFYNIDDNVPEQIIGDAKRLRQVLMNLVENAVKFTSHGQIAVDVSYSLHLTTGQPPELHFEVSDTGSGIQKEQLKQLFNGIPGKEATRNTGNETNGLGLVICKKLVELMGGTIIARSEPCLGSVFVFSIPLTPSLKNTREHSRIREMVALEQKQILIVDDNTGSRESIAKQLQSWKMLPVMAESGKQALEILMSNKNIDLVLADIQMPGMSGVQLAETINKSYTAIPVIAMNLTGDESCAQREDVFAAVITKPIRQAHFRDILLTVFVPVLTDKPITMNATTPILSNQYPLRVLIAEDNLINQKIAQKMLAKLGYEPKIANHGKEVMEMVSTEHFDVILMDVQMPEMDGLEATRMIRTCLEIQPVIIALTANAMQGDRDECIQAGMDDYMSKPIDPKLLASNLEKWALALKGRRRATA